VDQPYPRDLDPTAVKREREGSPGKGRRRGSAVLEIHIEVLPAVPNGDGVLDGLQEVTTSPKRWSTILGASCISGKGRPEVRLRHGRAEHGGVQHEGGGSGKRGSYRMIRRSRRSRW
jgi:hypothetical protein